MGHQIKRMIGSEGLIVLHVIGGFEGRNPVLILGTGQYPPRAVVNLCATPNLM